MNSVWVLRYLKGNQTETKTKQHKKNNNNYYKGEKKRRRKNKNIFKGC